MMSLNKIHREIIALLSQEWKLYSNTYNNEYWWLSHDKATYQKLDYNTIKVLIDSKLIELEQELQFNKTRWKLTEDGNKLAFIMHKAKIRCNAKRKFTKQISAIQFGKKVHQTPYYCRICKCWHLTSGKAGQIIKSAQVEKQPLKELIKRKSKRQLRRNKDVKNEETWKTTER